MTSRTYHMRIFIEMVTVCVVPYVLLLIIDCSIWIIHEVTSSNRTS
jgi:hypothetical protein